jgi:GTP cyclohydrolase II
MDSNFEKAITKLNTHYGEFDFFCYSWDKHEENNVLCLSNLKDTANVLIRVQSACYTAEIFRSLDCDCHEQLEESIKKIAKEGGIIIYMLCDGRGAGLLNKVKGLELGRTEGLDTADAYHKLNIPQDPRVYNRVVEILIDLKISSIKLLTNNPKKIEGIEMAGIKVIRESLEIPSTFESKSYLKTKALKMGHLISEFKNKS